MSELGPEDEALLRGARAGIETTPDDQARVKRKLFAQLGIGAAAGGSAIATSTGASAGAATTTVVAGGSVTKLLITAMVVGLMGGGALVLKGSRPHSSLASSSAAAIPKDVPQPNAAVTPSINGSASPIATLDTSQTAAPLATSLIVDAPTHRSSSRTSDPSAAVDRAAIADHSASTDTSSPAPLANPANAATPSNPVQLAVTPTPNVAGPATVDAEAALLRRADTELKSGRADHALALLDQHAAQFPNGVLTEEREAERVVVLCALGRTSEAHDAAAAFLSAHPQSPQAGRIRASCGGN